MLIIENNRTRLDVLKFNFEKIDENGNPRSTKIKRLFFSFFHYFVQTD